MLLLFSEVKLQASVSSVASSNAVPAWREDRSTEALVLICFFCENVAGAKRAAAGG